MHALASLGTVHAAKLKHNNEDVVVKVLRPDIRDTIVADMELLFSLANVLQRWLPDGKRLRPECLCTRNLQWSLPSHFGPWTTTRPQHCDWELWSAFL